MIIEIIELILIGVFTGIITGLTGASGVVIVVPLVNLLLDFTIHEAIGTSLIVDTIAPLAISATYYKYGNIDIRSSIWIAVGSMTGAQIGAFLVTGISGTSLGSFFGIFMTIMGIIMFRRGINRANIANRFNAVLKIEKTSQKIMVSILIGLALGIITGVIGAGGGVMILIVLIFVLGFPLQKAIGTSALIMAITTFSGSIGYAIHGNINVLSGIIIGIGAIVGGIGSARFANRVDEKSLGRVVASIFIILGLFLTILTIV